MINLRRSKDNAGESLSCKRQHRIKAISDNADWRDRQRPH